MIKWLGNHVVDFIARFRNDVYLENLPTTTETNVLVVDSDGKVSKSTTVAGDITSIDAGTGLSGTSLTGPIPTINIDTAQPTVTSLGTLTALTGGTGDLIWNTNTLVVDTSEAKVGIGTTSPGYKLDVNGEILADGLRLNLSDTVQRAITSTGTESIQIGDAGVNDIRFKNASGSVARMLANGNVGIGTSSPTQALHLPDNKQIALGTGADLKIQHNGTNSEIGNFTGSLNIYTHTDDGDINFQADNGSGGIETYFFLDGSNNFTVSNKYIRFVDNAGVLLGSSTDAQLIHDGTNTVIQNNTGDLFIKNAADDKDIIFQSDDGSGGVTAYLTLDGSATRTAVHKNMLFDDSVTLGIGASYDLQLYHNGSHSLISNQTGNLYLRNQAEDGDIIIQADDGSGGDATYMTFDGGIASILTYRDILMANDGNDGKIKFGASQDLSIYHDGSNSYIKNETGNLILQNNTDDGDIIFQSDDGSGGVADYFKLDGSVVMTRFSQTLNMFDNVKISIGTSQDLQVYHDATDNYIDSVNGDMYIRQLKDDKDIIFQSDDGSGGVETYFFLDGSFGSSPYTIFPDSSTLALGTGGDLRLYHDSSHSYIKSNGTGNIYIMQQNNDADISFWCDDGSGGDAEYFRLDGGLGWTVASKNIQFSDSIKASFGSSVDMIIQHNGTNSYIENATGNLEIINGQDDGDIIFKSDDGSGGIETYFFLDGSANGANPATVFPDNSSLIFGTGNDLYLRHTGTNSEIKNYVGDLIIANNANDKDIIFQSDDGSGGVTTYFQLDGSETKTIVSQTMEFQDNVKLAIGNSEDMTIDHNATDTRIMNYTGDLRILNAANDKDITFESDDGSGGVATYLTIDGSASQVLSSVTLKSTPPNANTHSLILGRSDTGNVWNVNHAGSDFRLYNAAGSGSDILFGVDSGSGAIANKVGIGVATPASLLHVAGTVQVGVDDTGHDVTFFGDASGEKMIWDTSAANLTIYHTDEEAGLLVFTNGGAQTTKPQLQVGRSASEYWGAYCTDRTAHLVHRQDETSGSPNTSFEIWDSNTTDSAAYWVWRHANGSGGSLTEKMRLTKAGVLSVAELDISGNVDVDGTTNLDAVDIDGAVQIDNTLTVGVDDTGHDVKFFGATAGSFLLWDESDDSLNLTDNTKLKFGDNNDFNIFHDGSNSFIQNQVGHLRIKNNADNKDIVLQCDNGSGGVTTYLTLDGSEETLVASAPLVLEADSTVGWHGSVTRVKILPRDFQSDSGGRPAMTATATNAAHLASNGSGKLFASVPIPTGFKATHVKIHGSDTGQTFTVYHANIANKVTDTIGAATAIETEKAIVNVDSTTTNYILIEVSSDGTTDEIHGGYMTIAPI